MKKLVALVMGVVMTLMSGCAFLQGEQAKLSADKAKADEVLAKIADYSVVDLQKALGKAKSDPVAAQCYAGLIPIVQDEKAKLEAAKDVPVALKGLFEVVQDIRNVIHGTQDNSLLDKVRMACDAFAASVIRDEVSISNQVATLVASGGATAPALVQQLMPLLKLLRQP